MIDSKFWLNPNFKNGFKASMLRSFIVDATNFAVYENVSQMLSKKALNLHWIFNCKNVYIFNFYQNHIIINSVFNINIKFDLV